MWKSVCELAEVMVVVIFCLFYGFLIKSFIIVYRDYDLTFSLHVLIIPLLTHSLTHSPHQYFPCKPLPLQQLRPNNACSSICNREIMRPTSIHRHCTCCRDRNLLIAGWRAIFRLFFPQHQHLERHLEPNSRFGRERAVITHFLLPSFPEDCLGGADPCW